MHTKETGGKPLKVISKTITKNEYDKLKAKADVCDELAKILERFVEYFCSDKALFPNGTLKNLCEDAEEALAKVKGIE